MEQLTSLFKVLSDETRIRIINVLAKQDLCVCELTDILDLSQPKISKHMAKIRSAKLVTTKRNEQYIYYSLNKDNKNLMNIIDTVLLNEQTQLQKDITILENMDTFVCSK